MWGKKSLITVHNMNLTPPFIPIPNQIRREAYLTQIVSQKRIKHLDKDIPYLSLKKMYCSISKSQILQWVKIIKISKNSSCNNNSNKYSMSHVSNQSVYYLRSAPFVIQKTCQYMELHAAFSPIKSSIFASSSSTTYYYLSTPFFSLISESFQHIFSFLSINFCL